jgi:hypothetical protein
MVEAQVPETLERAFLLARVQQEVIEEAKPRTQRYFGQTKADAVPARAEAAKPPMKLATGDFWKDRQLRDYRRLHNLCFKCGEKYDPTHQCGQKTVAVVNAMEQTDCHLLLSEEVLNILEMQDIPTLESLLKCNGWF